MKIFFNFPCWKSPHWIVKLQFFCLKYFWIGTSHTCNFNSIFVFQHKLWNFRDFSKLLVNFCLPAVIWKNRIFVRNNECTGQNFKCYWKIFLVYYKFCLVKCRYFQLFWSLVSHKIGVLRHSCTLCVLRTSFVAKIQCFVVFIIRKYF